MHAQKTKEFSACTKNKVILCMHKKQRNFVHTQETKVWGKQLVMYTKEMFHYQPMKQYFL